MTNDVNINLWAVLLGGVASLVIGAIYYHDSVLGKQWKKLAKIDAKRYDKEVGKLTPIMFLAALLTSFMVAYFAFLYNAYFQGSWIHDATVAAVLLWAGFSATTIVLHGVVEQKARQLLYITLGNRFFTYLATGLIVGWLHP
ncbi:MAG TPA: DUF1761 domain-containing protein [Candidatus Saccharimonadales bacterium]|nr:DUF1761 domain-containing protein [Candidatus Saccharimonadales bacterium]